MSKLELPSDIAEKVMGMLNPRDVPRALLVYEGGCFFIRGDACTRAELSALTFGEAEIENSDLLKVKNPSFLSECRLIIARALALGFEFRREEDRLNFNLNKMSMMHRRLAPREFA
jgi:hypothetical protein